MKSKQEYNEIKKKFTKVCRQNGTLKDYLLFNFMKDYIQKNDKSEQESAKKEPERELTVAEKRAIFNKNNNN